MIVVNPGAIVYARNPPVGSALIDPNDFYRYPIDPNSRKVRIQTSDPQLIINNISDINTWNFQVDFVPQIAVASSGSITPYIDEVAETNPTLKGKTIDQINLAWSLNKSVTSQVLTSDDESLDEVDLDVDDRACSFTGLDITTDTEFYLDLNDGKGLPGSTLQVVFKMLFGNYFYYGNYTSQLSKNTTGLQAILGGLNKDIVVSRAKELNPTGGANQHFFMAYPKSYGLPTISKNSMYGGWIRLKNVAGVLKGTLEEGETESDINISNGLISEAYYVFQSQFDNQADTGIKVVVE